MIVRSLVALALAFGLVAISAACGDDDTDVTQTPSPAASPQTASPVSDAPSPNIPSRTPISGLPSHTPWSSDPEGSLAFVQFVVVDGKQNQEIHIKQLPDGAEANLTNNAAEDFDPDISADGSKIAFASNRSGTTQIWTMNADGSDVRQLTDSSEGQTPRWSRDGARLAFSRGGDIVVMNLDGSGQRTVMESQPEATADPCRAGAFVGGWSSDDSYLTYYSASPTRQVAQVCTVAVDGSDLQVVVSEPGLFAVEPVYSPDGHWLAYRAITDGQHDIWSIDLATGERYNLTQDPDLDIEPSWSPDGQWIAFGSLRPGQPHFDLYIMRPDGSDVRRITTNQHKEANPVWAP
jgi:TolB protein